MSNPPNIRNFAAWINLMPGSDSVIIVKGDVETSASNNIPRLTRTDPQGISSQDLLLDLSIHNTGGIGTQAFQFRPVRYEEPASQGQYSTVTILWEGEPLVNLNVTEAH